ncbi:hypothetical protein ABIE41_003855 [Bosea sp. OAE506]
MRGVVIALLAIGWGGQAEARNTPCSGKKGGVSHCMGSYFVCKDGTTSQSKKPCSR